MKTGSKPKHREASAALYEKGMALVSSLHFKEAWEPLYEAASMGHAEAMAEIGYMRAYALGVSANAQEALSYLRKSAEMGCNYACYVLWEMYDDGFYGIDAEEAKRLCEEAARRGSPRAIRRLEDGFDLRPVTEILSEQAERGNTDALWYLAREYMTIGDQKNAEIFLARAVDAGQTDALLFVANGGFHAKDDGKTI